MTRKKEDDKPHKVLEIINLPGSARNFIGGQFKYLHEHGYEMHLICSDDQMMSTYAKENHINYHPVSLARTLSPLNDLKAFFKIFKYIRRNKIDTIIAHQAKARLLGTMAAFAAGVPNRIIFAHGVLFETLKGTKRKLVILMDKLVARLSHKTICVSPSVAKVRLKYNIEKHSRQYFLGKGTCGGIDTLHKFNPANLIPAEQEEIKKSLGIQDSDFIVGFCGRLVRDKGIFELVEGFRLFKQKYRNLDNFKLLIIGHKEARDSISRELNETIDTSRDITHIESVEYSEIFKYFSLFDVMVLPSYREGFGMVTIECGAMGVPAIVSKSTGCIDSIIEAKTGIYCDITPESIADQLDYMYTNPELRLEMGKNARKYIVDNYDNSVVWPNVIKVIES
ncbi:MAG: glycosyltransferase family 4 protein [Muribaculum sp.]|nr:glycosyltransferase family 4 protein [Muribaculum sp.]